MATLATNYFITDANGIFVGWYTNLEELTTEGQSLIIRGSAGADSVYVGTGTQVDAQAMGSGAAVDKVYLQGNFVDYEQISAPNSNVYVFQRMINGNLEKVTVAASSGQNDLLYFADGNVNLGFANLRVGTTFQPVTAAMVTGEGTPSFPVTVPLQSSAGATRIVIADTTGENIAAFYAGAVVTVRGNTGADSVYVGVGTQVDAQAMGSGTAVDKVYLQ